MLGVGLESGAHAPSTTASGATDIGEIRYGRSTPAWDWWTACESLFLFLRQRQTSTQRYCPRSAFLHGILVILNASSVQGRPCGGPTSGCGPCHRGFFRPFVPSFSARRYSRQPHSCRNERWCLDSCDGSVMSGSRQKISYYVQETHLM